jgi:hypothetical protein
VAKLRATKLDTHATSEHGVSQKYRSRCLHASYCSPAHTPLLFLVKFIQQGSILKRPGVHQVLPRRHYVDVLCTDLFVQYAYYLGHPQESCILVEYMHVNSS